MYVERPFLVSDGGTGATTAGGAQTNLGVPASTAVMLLSGSQSMAASLNFGGFTGTNAADPVSAQDLVTLNYLNLHTAGLNPSVRNSVRLASTANISNPLTGAPNVVDGVTPIVGDDILLKDQSTASSNGWYTVTTVGTGANGVWARTSGLDTSGAIKPGMNVYVAEGTQQGTNWMLTTDEPYTLGTTSLAFVQTNGAYDITAGNGLVKAGNTLSVQASNTTITVAGGGISVNQANLSLGSIGGTLDLSSQVTNNLPVTHGGTNSTTASGARSNLGAAPNTPSYWVGASNGEITNALVPSAGTGIVVTASTAVIAVDTSVVGTASNTLTFTNKTLTSPKIHYNVIAKTANYTGLAADDTSVVTFNITSGATYTLPASSGLTSGWSVKLKNKLASTANVSVKTTNPDTGENSTFSSSTAYPFPITPGSMIEFMWDGAEFLAL